MFCAKSRSWINIKFIFRDLTRHQLEFMRLHRFIIRDFDFNKKFIAISDKEIINQIKNVLRLKMDDHVILCDGKLNEALVKITAVRKGEVVGEILEISKNQNEPVRRVILYCSILKRENFELVVQKATEVGVAEIVPIIAKRTVKLKLKEERLKKIIREAAEQSGRGIIPALRDIVDFRKALDNATQNDVNLFFDVSGQKFSDSDFKMRKDGRVGVWIGPEGGWDEKEIELAKKQNFKIVSLGKLTLRAETAAIVASYSVVHS